jgi:hypothetical protein
MNGRKDLQRLAQFSLLPKSRFADEKLHLKELIKACAQPRTLEYISKKMGLDPIKITSL